jgi:hypothetical protein
LLSLPVAKSPSVNGDKTIANKGELSLYDAACLVLTNIQKWCAIQGSNLQKSPDSLGNRASASQIASQELGAALYGLDSVVESWLKLPPAFKAAILAIVDASATSQKQFPAGVLPVERNSLNTAELKG